MSQYDCEKTQAPQNVTCGAAQTNQANYPLDQYGAGFQAGRESAKDELDILFSYHPPTAETLPKFDAINEAARNFARVVRSNVPYCQDYVEAIRHIRDARMTANAAIALKGQGV